MRNQIKSNQIYFYTVMEVYYMQMENNVVTLKFTGYRGILIIKEHNSQRCRYVLEYMDENNMTYF